MCAWAGWAIARAQDRRARVAVGHLGAGSHGRFSAQFKRGGGWPDLSGTNESPEPTTGSGGVVWGGGGRGRSAHRGCPGCRCSKAENASLLRCFGSAPLRAAPLASAEQAPGIVVSGFCFLPIERNAVVGYLVGSSKQIPFWEASSLVEGRRRSCNSCVTEKNETICVGSAGPLAHPCHTAP